MRRFCYEDIFYIRIRHQKRCRWSHANRIYSIMQLYFCLFLPQEFSYGYELLKIMPWFKWSIAWRPSIVHRWRRRLQLSNFVLRAAVAIGDGKKWLRIKYVNIRNEKLEPAAAAAAVARWASHSLHTMHNWFVFSFLFSLVAFSLFSYSFQKYYLIVSIRCADLLEYFTLCQMRTCESRGAQFTSPHVTENISVNLAHTKYTHYAVEKGKKIKIQNKIKDL